MRLTVNALSPTNVNAEVDGKATIVVSVQAILVVYMDSARSPMNVSAKMAGVDCSVIKVRVDKAASTLQHDSNHLLYPKISTIALIIDLARTMAAAPTRVKEMISTPANVPKASRARTVRLSRMSVRALDAKTEPLASPILVAR